MESSEQTASVIMQVIWEMMFEKRISCDTCLLLSVYLTGSDMKYLSTIVTKLWTTGSRIGEDVSHWNGELLCCVAGVVESTGWQWIKAILSLLTIQVGTAEVVQSQIENYGTE